MSSILLAGEGNLLFSVAACLQRAGHVFSVYATDPVALQEKINGFLTADSEQLGYAKPGGSVSFCSQWDGLGLFDLIILITPDRTEVKRNLVSKFASHLSPKGVIAVNLLSVGLEEIQQGFSFAPQIAGLNWVEPAHTTFFLEIIGNEVTPQEYLQQLEEFGKSVGKDPYIVRGGFSVKARLNAALTREALFLVSNGYATHEDIDRNCRNDAGYYLPFVGNARYMDLMGTYAYGVVMKDLNKHLSKDQQLDEESHHLIRQGFTGMDKGRGFFEYTEEEVEEWKTRMDSFSYQIHHLIQKYPFGTQSE